MRSLPVAAPEDTSDAVPGGGAAEFAGGMHTLDRGEGLDAISAAALGLIERRVGELDQP